MAHVIALQGAGDSGKTDTIIRVFQVLKAKYPTATVLALHGATADVKIIMHNVKGNTVGIESQGDPGSRLQQSLSDFVAANCDIIFCACRTRGMTVNWIKALSSTHRVQFVSQTWVAQGHAVANAAMAASLVKTAGL